MNDFLNPYIAGAPVTESSMFFGREEVFGWIERSLTGKYVDHILVVHGQRRVGKTSVLKQIPNYLGTEYLQIFFDLQGRVNTTLERFLWWMARETARTLNREHGFQIPKPDRANFEGNPDYLITEFFPSIQTQLPQQRLLLTFDEFDTLGRLDIQESLARPLITYLTRLMTVEGLNFIFSIGSSGNKLENMQSSYTNFFKSALYRKISFLDRESTRRLVTKPVEGLIEYQPDAVERIYQITAGHPYFTQLTCHELFSLCQKSEKRTLTAADVASVVNDVIERGTVNLKFVWDEASTLEKWVLASLAQFDQGASNKKLMTFLRQQGVNFLETDLNSAVIHLRDKDVIDRDNQFVVHLMRLWLQQNRPLDRVREELTEVNPIANRYIEIGNEYRARGGLEEALEHYQQALEAAPEYFQAQINIATTLLDKEDYQQAVPAFQKALEIEPSDVVAQTGLCDAMLAIGDQARERGDIEKALQQYQQILTFNQSHLDARQRLAGIYTERAETHLEDGKDDLALSAFNQALEYTPEDQVLRDRYEQLREQKKARVINEWLTKAERALTQQRWDEAEAMVAEALKLDPENEELQARWAEVQDAPRQHRLQSYRREAEEALQRNDYPQALEAIQHSLELAPEDPDLTTWLEETREAHVEAQLADLNREAGQAFAADDWDRAMKARQQALKLAPDNPALKKALRETQDAVREAQLAAFEKRVAVALTREAWDEARGAARQALELAPDAAPWKAKLAEIDAAQHQARLDKLREEAHEARANQNYENALTALEDLLQLEPEDQQAQTLQQAIRREKREHELALYRSQARAAEEGEAWTDAVEAWTEYLALKPEDQAEAEKNLDHARTYARIASDYQTAREALRQKNFGKAIPLLQGIIAQDPTYKSTSRLLTEAVEARRQKTSFWQQTWVFPTAGAVLLLILGILFGPRLLEIISLIKTPSPQTQEFVSAATGTLAPNQEADTLPPGTSTPTTNPARIFADPYLASISRVTPNYSLYVFSEEDQRAELSGEAYQEAVADQYFVMQIAFLPTDFADDQPLQVAFISERYYGSVILDFQTSGEWAFYYDFEGIRFDIDSGSTPHLNDNASNLLQLIVNQQEIALYFNSQPLTYLKNIQMQGDLNWSVLNTITAQNGAFSEIQLWDLSALDGETASGEEADPTQNPLIATQRARATATVQAQLQNLIYQVSVAEEEITSISWSPEGDRFAVASADGQGVRVLDGETGEVLQHWKDHAANVLIWSPNGYRIAAGNDNGEILFFDSDSGELLVTLPSTLGEITALNWSPEGGQLAAGDDQGYLSIWDVTSLPAQEMVSRIHEKEEFVSLGRIFSISFPPPGIDDYILIVGDDFSQDYDHFFRYSTLDDQFYDQLLGELLSNSDYIYYFSNAAWGPNHLYYAYGHKEPNHPLYSPSALIIKTRSGATKAYGMGHSDQINYVTWAPEGTIIASTGQDSTVQFWTDFDAPGENISINNSGQFPLEHPGTWLAWSPDGDVLLAGDSAGNIYAWDVSEIE